MYGEIYEEKRKSYDENKNENLSKTRDPKEVIKGNLVGEIILLKYPGGYKSMDICMNMLSPIRPPHNYPFPTTLSLT